MPKPKSLQWRHDKRDGVSDYQPHDCLLNRLFKRRSKKTSKPHVTGLCAGNSPASGDFPAQMASNAENVSFWWRHHDFGKVKARMGLLKAVSVLPKHSHQWHQLWSVSWSPSSVEIVWSTCAILVLRKCITFSLEEIQNNNSSYQLTEVGSNQKENQQRQGSHFQTGLSTTNFQVFPTKQTYISLSIR